MTYFCRTFSRELGINFKFTAEELETALVRPQNMLLVDVRRCPPNFVCDPPPLSFPPLCAVMVAPRPP